MVYLSRGVVATGLTLLAHSSAVMAKESSTNRESASVLFLIFQT